MLDQNTDRMWYVIGAVIIGAAIILIMNKTFPQLFASVGDTFKSKTDQTTEIVDGIMPVQTKYGPNKIVDGFEQRSVVNIESTAYYPSGKATEVFINYDLEEVLKPETTYLFTFDYKSTSNVYSIDTFFLGNRPESYRSSPTNTKDKWETWSYTFTTKDPVADPVQTWYEGNAVRFDNNYSRDGERAILSVKNVSVREVLGGK